MIEDTLVHCWGSPLDPTSPAIPVKLLRKFSKLDEPYPAEAIPVHTGTVDGQPVMVCWGCHPGGVFDSVDFQNRHLHKGVLKLTDRSFSSLDSHFKNVHGGNKQVLWVNPHAQAWTEAKQKLLGDGCRDLMVTVRDEVVRAKMPLLREIERLQRQLQAKS